MKRKRPAIQSCSGLLLAGAVIFQVSFLPAQNIPIAVVEFEGNGISQTEAIALTDRLRNELFRLGAFEVVERGMMETILTEQDFQMTGCTSNECLVEVGQLLGARQVVGGRISRVGAMFTVSARVVDVQTGKLLGVSDFDLRGGLEEMLTDGMKQVAVMLSPGEKATLESGDRPIPPQTLTGRNQVLPDPLSKGGMFPQRWQALIGNPIGQDRGTSVEVTRFLSKKNLFAKYAIQPTISLGYIFRHRDIVAEDFREDKRITMSVAVHSQVIGQRVGGGAFIGIGMGFGEFTVSDDYYIDGYEDIFIGNPSSDPELVIYIGSQIITKLPGFQLFIDARLHYIGTFGTSTIVSAGIAL